MAYGSWNNRDVPEKYISNKDGEIEKQRKTGITRQTGDNNQYTHVIDGLPPPRSLVSYNHSCATPSRSRYLR